MAIQFVKLNVEGMSCSHCEQAVMKAVGEMDGVSKVEVSLQDKTVSVEFDPGRVTVDSIKDTIEDLGYDVL